MAAQTPTGLAARSVSTQVVFSMANTPVNNMIQVPYLMVSLVPRHLNALQMEETQVESHTTVALPTSTSATHRINQKSASNLEILLQIILSLKLLHGLVGVTSSRLLSCAPLPPTKSSLRV